MDIPNREAWERWAEEHAAVKQKLADKRKRLQGQLHMTDQLLKAAPATSLQARALGYQKRLFEIAIGQMEPYNLDSDVYQRPTQVLAPGYQLRDQEMNLLVIQLEDVHLSQIARTLSTDLPLALAGKPPAKKYPAPYMQIRAKAAADPSVAEKLQAFLAGYPDHHTNVEAAAELFRLALAEANDKERLEQVKAMRLPALKGSSFRLVGLLRQIPEGAAWWNAIKMVDAPAVSDEPPPEEPMKPIKRFSARMMNLLKPSK